MNEPRTLKHIRSAIQSEPWSIMPSALEQIAAIVEVHVAGEPVTFQPKQKQWLFGKPEFIEMARFSSDEETEPDPYAVVDGVALLPLQGPLFPKANLMTMFSGATSYQEFTQWFTDALNRSDVNAIAIVADSPGGYSRGMAEVSNTVFAGRGVKPIIGVCESGLCCSAAYGIVSQCDEVFCSPSSMMGSIGVVGGRESDDRAARNAGIDRVQIASSELKSFGVPETLAQYQSLIDTISALFEQFKEIVMRGRGKKLDMAKVDKAQVMIGRQAVLVGLADGMRSLSDIIEEHRAV
jgi:ClpP class serine protease